ncbi:MAG: FIST signal transduction protein [Vicinamibacterales bacterium]
MQVGQQQWTEEQGWRHYGESPVPRDAQLVLVFGATDRLRDPSRLTDLRSLCPDAALFGCSTSGEIAGPQVFDDSIVGTALRFENTKVRVASTPIESEADSHAAGCRLAGQLAGDHLSHVLVLSDGLKVNGSQLVEGLASVLPANIAVTGGLAGDGTRFQETLVVCGDRPQARIAAAVGFYGTRLHVGYASLGGWDPFGPERIITRAAGNVLFELDGQSALGLYKQYLGEHASDLPASALLFPLSVRRHESDEPLVRTILGIDDAASSMTFAGDMPMGARARLMKANFDRLVDGATGAARASHAIDEPADLALLISCVGRKLVLKQRTEEEVEAVRDVLGDRASLTGFYSYGEISPFVASAKCQLHNQTMTVTTFSESVG